jgi:hypothetical protein
LLKPCIAGDAEWDGEMLENGALGSHSNPVLCFQPVGERAYLDRLRCSNGQPPWYERIGSFGAWEDGHVIDGYDVICDDYRTAIFLDMYHKGHAETEPVQGFTIGEAAWD